MIKQRTSTSPPSKSQTSHGLVSQFLNQQFQKHDSILLESEYEPKELKPVFIKALKDIKEQVKAILAYEEDIEQAKLEIAQEQYFVSSTVNSGVNADDLFRKLDTFKSNVFRDNITQKGQDSSNSYLEEQEVSPNKSESKLHKKGGNLLFSLKEKKSLLFLAGKEELKSSQPLSGEDLLLLRMEKLCIDFLQVIQKNKTFEVKLLSQTIDNSVKIPQAESFCMSSIFDTKRQSLDVIKEDFKDQQESKRIEQFSKQGSSTFKPKGPVAITTDLEQKLSDKDQQIDSLSRRLQLARNTIDQMRNDYLKDVSHLREYMFQKDQSRYVVDYIDVRYFQVAQDLDDKSTAIINEKIAEMGMKYNLQIHQLQRTNELYFKQITLFELICKDGNVLISLNEMNAHDIVKKLNIIEKNPLVVWKAIENHYGFGFFHKIIEEEYGITPDFQEKIKKDFLNELNKAKADATTKINKITQETRLEITKLVKELRDKNAEMSKQRQQFVQKIDLTKDEMRFSIQKESQKLVTDIEKEYQDKMTFLTQKIFNLENGFKDGQSLEKEEWKKFYDREIEILKSQNISLMKSNTEVLYNLHKSTIECDQLKHQFEEVNMNLEQLQNDYQSRKKLISNLEVECKCAKDTFSDCSIYLETLEKELERINQQVIKLSKAYPDLQRMLNNTPLNQLKKLKNKSAHDVNLQVSKALVTIMSDKTRDKYTLTEIYDLHKDLNFKVSDETHFKIPMTDEEIQAAPLFAEVSNQCGIANEGKVDIELSTDLDRYGFVELEQKADQFDELKAKLETLQQQFKSGKAHKNAGKKITEVINQSFKRSATMIGGRLDSGDKSKNRTISDHSGTIESEKSSLNVDDGQRDKVLKRTNSSASRNDNNHFNQKKTSVQKLYENSVTELPKDEEDEDETHKKYDDDIIESEDISDGSSQKPKKKIRDFQYNNEPIVERLEGDSVNINIQNQDLFGGNYSKSKAQKKKKKNSLSYSRKVQVYKIVPYNIPHLEKLLNKRAGPLKVNQSIQTEPMINIEHVEDSEQEENQSFIQVDQRREKMGVQRSQRHSQNTSPSPDSQHTTTTKHLKTHINNSQYSIKSPVNQQFIGSNRQESSGSRDQSLHRNAKLESDQSQFKYNIQNQGVNIRRMAQNKLDLDVIESHDQVPQAKLQSIFNKGGAVQRLKDMQATKRKQAEKASISTMDYQRPSSRQSLIESSNNRNHSMNSTYFCSNIHKGSIMTNQRGYADQHIAKGQASTLGETKTDFVNNNYAAQLDLLHNNLNVSGVNLSNMSKQSDPYKHESKSHSNDNLARNGKRAAQSRLEVSSAEKGQRLDHFPYNQQVTSYKQRRKIYSHFHSTHSAKGDHITQFSQQQQPQNHLAVNNLSNKSLLNTTSSKNDLSNKFEVGSQMNKRNKLNKEKSHK